MTRAELAAAALGRIARAMAGAAAGAAVAACLEARWAAAPDAGAFVVADLGLLAPVSLAVGAGVGAALVALEPTSPRTPAALLRALSPGDDAARGARTATLALAPPVAFLWATLVAHFARRTFAAFPSARAAGLATAAGALALSFLAAAAVVASRPFAAARLPAPARRPLLAGAAGLACTALALAFGIAHGTTGGEGGLVEIWAVLKRPELDLRAPALLTVVGAAALAGPYVLARLPAAIAVFAFAAPLALTSRAATALDRDAATTAAIERGAPLGGVALKLARKRTDRDHDGASPHFGGGDCDDHDPAIGPFAVDEPGDGIDQDCSGADAVRPVAPPPPSAPRAPRAALADDWNVLLVTIDALRADLGYAGYPKPISPNLDALAARSTVFTHAYSLASYTGKSIGPLLIGKYPSETHRGWGHFNSFGKDDTNVAERLHAAGIRTLAFQAHWYFAPFTGLSRGFDAWDMSAVPAALGQQDNDAAVTGDKLTRAVIRGLSKPENVAGRFFAWVHYVDPHAEYMRHDGAPDLGSGIRAPYDAEVWFVDRQIGELLRFVDAQPWGKRTAIVVTSDHGEAFAEHRMIRHGFEVWEELVRVPLLVYVPGVAPRTIDARRSGVDVVPTVLDLMRVPPPDGSARFDFLSGRSLLDDVLAPDPAKVERRPVFVDMPAGPNNDERRALYDGDEKLVIANAVRFSLYDLAADPGETHDLAADAERLAKARARYEAFKSTLREVYVKPIPKE